MSAKPSRKRIAIFIMNMAGGGAERVALASMEDLLERGHKVDLVLVRAEGALMPLVPDGVRVVELGASRIMKALWPLVRYLRRDRPDVIHAVMWPITVIALLAVRVARSRTEVVVSEQVALHKTPVTSTSEMAAMRLTTRLFYPRANAIIACSNDAAEALSRLSGIRSADMEVIYNPISPPETIEPLDEAEALWGDAKERLIAVGSLKPQKNHKLLIEAFAKLKSRPKAKLMILGEGPLRAELAELARSAGVADRLIMPGFFLEPWPYLASAHLFVMSSDWEGFPLALAEGMYAGLRVVSTDCNSGPAEMTAHGKFGRLVPCGDADALAAAIDAALDEPPRPEEMRRQADNVAGIAMVHRYSEVLGGS
jgi:glycosyltransferase involved in cell wall biosynthesis